MGRRAAEKEATVAVQASPAEQRGVEGVPWRRGLVGCYQGQIDMRIIVECRNV